MALLDPGALCAVLRALCGILVTFEDSPKRNDTVTLKPVTKERWRLPPRDSEVKPVAPQTQSTSRYRWKALLGLVLVYSALVLDLYSLWALVLLWWAVTDIVNRETWFMETVRRSENAVVYWLLICSWLGFSVLLVLLDVNPQWRS